MWRKYLHNLLHLFHIFHNKKHKERTMMNDQDEMFERGTETPAFLGCPQHMPVKLPGGFDGVGSATETVPPHGGGTRGGGVSPALDKEELQKRGAKLKASNDRSYAKMVRIAELANECILKTTHCEYEHGQYGQDYQRFGKAFSEIRALVRESIADVYPDYEMLALQFARNSFDFGKFQEALAAVASMKQDDFPGFYYTPGWLVELAKKLEADGSGSETLPPQGDDVRGGAVSAASLTPEEQSALQREEARQMRKIHWTCYPTKVDLCVMGRTEQNGKVYEVRISKRGDSKVQDTYGQCKVNGKTVVTCSFTGNAWMLKRILTEGMQALVNYKAKKKRDSRRNYAKRDAVAKAAGEVK